MKRPVRTILLLAAALALGAAGHSWIRAQQQQPARLFELRIYTTHPGKLPDLHQRFREHTNRLFVKHGMQLVGYWTPADFPQSDNTLIYLLAFPSREARQKAWDGFRNDPEWKRVFAASRADGPIVTKVESKLMVPTDYSPLR